MYKNILLKFTKFLYILIFDLHFLVCHCLPLHWKKNMRAVKNKQYITAVCVFWGLFQRRFRGLASCVMEGEGAVKSLQSWCFSQRPCFNLRADAVSWTTLWLTSTPSQPLLHTAVGRLRIERKCYSRSADKQLSNET